MWTVTHQDTWKNAAGTEYNTVHVECFEGEYLGEVIVYEREANGEEISSEEIAKYAREQGVPMAANNIDWQ